jgi:hypothetical protein
MRSGALAPQCAKVDQPIISFWHAFDLEAALRDQDGLASLLPPPNPPPKPVTVRRDVAADVGTTEAVHAYASGKDAWGKTFFRTSRPDVPK